MICPCCNENVKPEDVPHMCKKEAKGSKSSLNDELDCMTVKEDGVRDETIRQAAKDYDMDYDTAKWIHDKDPDLFYENMEEYIKERAKAN